MKKLLLVDDSKFMRTILKDIIGGLDGIVIVGEGENGREAVNLALKLDPDLVILDINMDIMNGIEALTKIRDLESNIKVIMCTSMGQETMVKEAYKNGACDFIVKPFVNTRVINVINKCLSS